MVLLVDDGSHRRAAGGHGDAVAVRRRPGRGRGSRPPSCPSPTPRTRSTRRVIKARDRGRDGDRSEGFTVVCPSVRAPFLTHDQFDAHWRDNHSRIHVASSPGTCHYEQLIIDEVLTPDAPSWDGVGLLSFASSRRLHRAHLRRPGGSEGDLRRRGALPRSGGGRDAARVGIRLPRRRMTRGER